MNSRFLKPFACYLNHHYLWQFNRRTVASGVAIGLFFGLLVPFAQILLAAAGAVFWRANLPVAAFSTLVTNPFTFAPIYYFAYKLGHLLTSWTGTGQMEDTSALALVSSDLTVPAEWMSRLLNWMMEIGLPLGTGLSVLAVASAAGGYFITHTLWRWHVARRWQKRQRGLCSKA